METITRNIPVLALRGLTAFPGQTVSFDAERDISIFALTTPWRMTADCWR